MKALTATETCSGLRDSGRAVELTCTKTIEGVTTHTQQVQTETYTFGHCAVCSGQMADARQHDATSQSYLKRGQQ